MTRSEGGPRPSERPNSALPRALSLRMLILTGTAGGTGNWSWTPGVACEHGAKRIVRGASRHTQQTLSLSLIGFWCYVDADSS